MFVFFSFLNTMFKGGLVKLNTSVHIKSILQCAGKNKGNLELPSTGLIIQAPVWRDVAPSSFREYHISMNRRVLCKPSAFKHGITLDQILHVLDDPRYEGPVEIYENKYLVLGFDPAGNLLEIMYNEREDGGFNVFHAMPCRSIFSLCCLMDSGKRSL